MPTSLDEVREHFAYGKWANDRFREVIASLPGDQLTATIESSFASIVETFAHIVAAEWIWLRRWKGENPSTIPGWLEQPEFDALVTRLAGIEAERDDFLATLDEKDLEEVLRYRTMDGVSHANRLADLFLHVVNHSTYHRGQLTTMLRQVGATPPATDFIVFKREE
jgi:uncharacterized damage-inducible protein DinB